MTQLGDLSTINVDPSDRDDFVEAINKIISTAGQLSTLTTTDTSSLVNAINETLGHIVVDDAVITIGTEGTEGADIIRVSVQLKNVIGDDTAVSSSVFAYLSDDVDGSSLVATEPDGGWVIGSVGLLVPLITNKTAQFISDGTGLFNIDITESGVKTVYLVIVLPSGVLKISSAITFA